jgi:hypothetical protein
MMVGETKPTKIGRQLKVATQVQPQELQFPLHSLLPTTIRAMNIGMVKFRATRVNWIGALVGLFTQMVQLLVGD